MHPCREDIYSNSRVHGNRTLGVVPGSMTTINCDDTYGTVAIAIDQPRPDITRNKGVRPKFIDAMFKLLLSRSLSRGIVEKGSRGLAAVQPILYVTVPYSLLMLQELLQDASLR